MVNNNLDLDLNWTMIFTVTCFYKVAWVDCLSACLTLNKKPKKPKPKQTPDEQIVMKFPGKFGHGTKSNLEHFKDVIFYLSGIEFIFHFWGGIRVCFQDRSDMTEVNMSIWKSPIVHPTLRMWIPTNYDLYNMILSTKVKFNNMVLNASWCC